MKVHINRPSTCELVFAFDADGADAIVPVPTVWFRCGGFRNSASLPVALMGYLMARPFIGNSFELSGPSLSAHLAAKLHQDLNAHEFFVGPVTNIPERIVPDFQHDTMDACIAGRISRGRNAFLVCERNELGYSVGTASSRGGPLLSIATNVDLFTAYTEAPELLSFVLVYLYTLGTLRIRRLRVHGDVDADWLRRVGSLVAEVGGSVSFESARGVS